MAIGLKHMAEPAPSPRALRPELPAWLDRLVLQCLEKDPARRFATAEALLGELQRPRSDARLRSRRLPSGDNVLEDAGESSDWALVLQAREQKTGWSDGMALRFEERFYRLERVDAPAEKSGRWTYRFVAWPDCVVFRKLVDYEQDAEQRAQAPSPLGARLHRLLSGGKQ
jgi:serine/threonine protein kinase